MYIYTRQRKIQGAAYAKRKCTLRALHLCACSVLVVESVSSSKHSIEEHICKARAAFFSHGQLGAFQQLLNLLSSRSFIEGNVCHFYIECRFHNNIYGTFLLEQSILTRIHWLRHDYLGSLPRKTPFKSSMLKLEGLIG